MVHDTSFGPDNILPFDNSSEKLGFRQPPSNEEAEQALLGAILVSNRALESVAEFLRAEHFFTPVHGRIYDAIARVVERGQSATPVTLKPFFEKDEDLTHLGGSAYLADLAANVVTVVNAIDYARALHDLHVRRQLIGVGEGHGQRCPCTQSRCPRRPADRNRGKQVV